MIAATRSEINSFLRRIDKDYRHFILQTPLWIVPGAALGVPCAQVWLKLEHLQTGGSFKARGALWRLLSHTVPASGVLIASGGNAGIATAAAARLLGVPCEVFLPEVSSQAKRERLRALGAQVRVVGAAYAQAYAACLERQQETGALLNHAYDQTEVVAGAGTLAAEIEAQQGLPDTVLVSVGGGGLIAGMAAHCQGRAKVIALEPRLAPTLFEARKAGRPVDVAVSGVAADSLGAKRIGDIAWQVAQTAVHDALLLEDEAIRAAQLWLWRELKLAVEPAAALGLAALQTGVYRPQAHERVCLVLCGANIDPASLNA
ncbi:MAG: threonine/serine dehydratase [Burkholderiaceae bacterium]